MCTPATSCHSAAAPPPGLLQSPFPAFASGYPLRRSPTPSCAACPGRSGPLSALLRGAPAGATAPRWGRVQRCGEAWPPAGALGALPRGGAKRPFVFPIRCFSYPPRPLQVSDHPSFSGCTPRRLSRAVWAACRTWGCGSSSSGSNAGIASSASSWSNSSQAFSRTSASGCRRA